MQARLERHDISHADAAARLRYLGEVQQRVRRATLAPSFALLALGAIATSHGLLATFWPHAAALSVVWIAALVAVRPGLRRLRHHLDRRRGLQARGRLRIVPAAAAGAVAALAILVGANALISAVAAATALAAYLAGMPAVAASAAGVGVVGDIVVRHGMAPATAQLIVGAGLLAAGLASLAQEREGA
jgi:hypothetical protein